MGLLISPSYHHEGPSSSLTPSPGASLGNNFLNQLIPDVDFDHEDCDGDACFQRNQVLSLDRAKRDPATKLAYNERSLAYASTQGLIATCLPNAKKEEVAGSFKSCQGHVMEEVCVFAKRGWLVKDVQEDTVANLDLLIKSFSGLEGGDAAVKKCMKIKEEAEVKDDEYEYEYYDYADYYDEYDYLEEGEGRRKREAGNGGKNGGKNGDKKGNGQGNKSKGKKPRNEKKNKGNEGKTSGNPKNSRKSKGNKGKTSGNPKNSRKSKGNKGKKNEDKKKGKKNKDKKKGKKGNPIDGDRKLVKKPDKKPSAENDAKLIKRLNKLGFTKMPTKSTKDGLDCMWNKLEDLLVKCGEKILSNTP